MLAQLLPSMMFDTNVYYPDEIPAKSNRPTVCNITWITSIVAISALILITNAYTDEQIAADPTLKAYFVTIVLVFVPLLGFLTYCRFPSSKKALSGRLLLDLRIGHDEIRIGNYTCRTTDISSLDITISGYRNFYSHGVDNCLAVRTIDDENTIRFELQSKSDYSKLLLTISALRTQGVAVTLTDELARK
ncbi:hypothetical protein IMPR6_340063 [Imperialibacter sp. EC-SDR9]|nr:hypothetical protein IMPERIA75_350064 [Imperialibacter sp. 75]CAD5300050.1 hypothetical protein IMPERIA89_90064 [Imperialibacter sp. 89]VVT22050.1 hypothetical protein IMPR6_340063 [Imperialibacter sp. EC-SDR9]